MRVTLGYPDAAHRTRAAEERRASRPAAAIPPAFKPDGVIELQSTVRNVFYLGRVARLRAGAYRPREPASGRI